MLVLAIKPSLWNYLLTLKLNVRHDGALINVMQQTIKSQNLLPFKAEVKAIRLT